MSSQLIVSITSYPARINTVHFAIESILAQSLKADKVILWLATEQFPNKENDLPSNLITLKRKGLEIEWCNDIKSYKKLIPTLKKYPNDIIVTADDDNIYENKWLQKLYESYKKNPDDIHCHRITKFYYDGEFRFISGGKDYYKKACFLNKVVGLGGVLYPPNCFYKDILNEKLFMKLAPTNDDIWFWLQAVLNNRKVRVIKSPLISANYTPNSQQFGLFNINDKGENLFWKDFYNMLNYYTTLKSKLVNESFKLNPFIPKGMEYYERGLFKWYKKVTGCNLNLDNPQTFNEKIQWLKLYDSTPLKTRLADKYLVRDWVKEKIGEQYLIPLLGVYDKFEDIDFEELPDQFVIKCNHGSGYNIIVTDKEKLNLYDTKQKINKWMKENYAFKYGFELHYRDIKPLIIIEEFLEEISNNIYDYRFFCCNGKVEQIWLDVGSGTNEHKRKIFDRNWNEFNITVKWPVLEAKIEKPKNLSMMIKLSEKLSTDFPLVRVDFYNINSKIYFGEMTFTSMSGTGKFQPSYEDLNLGKKISLPPKVYNIDTGENVFPTKTSLLKRISKILCNVVYFKQKKLLIKHIAKEFKLCNNISKQIILDKYKTSLFVKENVQKILARIKKQNKFKYLK